MVSVEDSTSEGEGDSTSTGTSLGECGGMGGGGKGDGGGGGGEGGGWQILVSWGVASHASVSTQNSKSFLYLCEQMASTWQSERPQWPLSAPESNFSKLYTSLSYCCVMPAWTGWKDSYAEMVVASAVFFWEIMSL